MGFLQIQYFLKLLSILLIIFSSRSSNSANLPNFPIAKPNCMDRCGDLNIPYPFGTTKECYESYGFFISCNQTIDPPKAFMQNTSTEITDISLDGQLRALQFVGHDCYSRNGTRLSYSDPWISLPISLIVNSTANKFIMVGCDTYGFISGRRLNRNYKTGCTAMCDATDDLTQGYCTGVGCCQTSIPKDVWRVELTLRSYENFSNVWSFNNCSYAFLVEERAFTFSPENLTNLSKVKKLPMVVDWAIGNGTCEEAQKNASSYACRSDNSKCYKPSNGYGYRCSCLEGYQGNPYLIDGCQDIDECSDTKLNNCEKRCENTIGSFDCGCPKGYHGDGRKDGQGCTREESIVSKLVAGICLGIITLLLLALLLYLDLKRRRQMKMRQKFFLQNGGVLLQEKIVRIGSSSNATILFGAYELQKATNNFHNNMIIGQGGFGTVYKGILSDNRTVAIKKSKEVDPNQIEQFINEVIILSQVNHRNVVKLLGCCLETQAPLLVYEFISNGTLFEHIHNKMKASLLSWEIRLRIAIETANVLAYLHSTASIPIIHRDIKSANILLDHTLTAKVADFGASRLVPFDQTQLNTMVQGTFGYLDPEYMQTNQLTEKSDVYSFGVVLVELLTGKQALSFDRSVMESVLANHFLYVMKQDRLFDILEDNVLREGNDRQLMEVAIVAKKCLYVKGDDRPCMKEVATELEGLRRREKHPWTDERDNEDDNMMYLIGEGFINVDINGNGTSIDSVVNHDLHSLSGGR